MRKFFYFSFVLVPLLILIACGGKKRETITKTGTVGTRVNLSVLQNDLKGNNEIEWNFIETPGKTRLSKYDFNPMFNRPQVSFVPPDSGVYKVVYNLQDQSGKVVGTQHFTITVKAPSTTNETENTETMEQSNQPETVTPSPPANKTKKTETKPPAMKQPTPAATSTSGKNRADMIPKIPGEYTVQIASVKKRSGAERLVQQLQDLGFDAYIQRAKFPDTGEIWYRVRSGKFNNYDEAKKLATRLQAEPQLSDLTIWVDSMRQDT